MTDLPIGSSRFGSTALAPHRVAFLGDSITAFAINSSATIKQWTNWGYVSWVRWASRQRFYTDHSLVVGVSSQGTAHLLAVQVPAAIAARAQIAVIHIGINDIGGNDLPLTDMISNMDQAIALLNAYGMAVLIVPIAPTNNNGVAGQGFANPAKQQKIAAFNRWCWLQAQKVGRAVRYADIWPAMVDYSTGFAKTEYLVDGLHDNVVSAQVKAQVVGAALNTMLPVQDPPIHSIHDTFDASLSPQGSMLGAIGLFGGTSGTTKNSGTGSVATGWTAGRNASSASTLSVALSKLADPDYSTLTNQVVTIGGVSDGTIAEVDSGNLTVTGLAAGMSIYLEAEAEWASLAGVKSVAVQLTYLDGATTISSEDGSHATGKGLMAAVGAGMFRTEPLLLPSGFTNVRARLKITSDSSGSAAGSATWKRAALRVASLDGMAGL